MRISAQVSVLVALGVHGRLQEVWQTIGCYRYATECFDQSITVDISVPCLFKLNGLPKIKPTMSDMMIELRSILYLVGNHLVPVAQLRPEGTRMSLAARHHRTSIALSCNDQRAIK
jgi:hypothetical protein